MRILLLAAVALPLTAQIFDSAGRLTHLVYDGDELAVRTSLAATLRGRAKVAYISASAVSRDSASPSRWTGVFEPETGMRAGFEQNVSEGPGKAEIAVQVSPEPGFQVDAVYFVIRVPWEAFAGGTALNTTLPAIKPAEAEVTHSVARQVRLENAARTLALTVNLDRESPVAIRDEWDESGHSYSLWIEIAGGALKTAVSIAGKGNHAPAALAIDTAHRRYRFDGFGGNYCFEIESPTTDYTLKNLKVRWARVEMTLLGWSPENDKPGSRLRHELELAQRIQKLGIPYIISIWQVPGWAVEHPEITPFRENHRIALTRWDELAETITSYLLYAKRAYGVEPTLFSFNEANIGINVLFTPEEHRDVLKSLGRRFAAAGLKTRLLLGDASPGAGNHPWVLAAANDPAVRPLIGAVAFHSWDGATPEQYKAWGDVADWLGLPLLVTELGVDPFAWRGAVYNSYDYGLREVRMYQELLLHARPRATMQWEFTADYGLVDQKGPELTPTARFWLVKHFTDLTPQDSEAIGSSSDVAGVLVTAFARGSDYAVHVANFGASRPATLRGLPAGAVRAVLSTEGEPFRDLPLARVMDGVVKLDLPARSLLTLTTLPR